MKNKNKFISFLLFALILSSNAGVVYALEYVGVGEGEEYVWNVAMDEDVLEDLLDDLDDYYDDHDEASGDGTDGESEEEVEDDFTEEFAGAEEITPGYYLNEVYPTLKEKWYKILVPAKQNLSITVNYTKPDFDYDFDIDIYDINEEDVEHGNNYDGSAYPFVIRQDYSLATNNEYYYIRITYIYDWEYQELMTNPYNLTVELKAFDDDIMEDNDDESNYNDLAFGGIYRETFTNLMSVYGDEDWYAVPFRTHEKLQVSIEFENSSGNLDLGLYQKRYSTLTLVNTSHTENDQEIVSIIGTSLSNVYRYLIRVNNTTPGTVNNYTMIIDTLVGDDNYESNDDATDAKDLYIHGSTSTKKDLISRYGDDDWYYTDDFLENEILRVILTFENSSGNLDLAIYNSSGASLGSLIDVSQSENDQEEIYLIGSPNPSVTKYFIKVNNTTPGTNNSYSLELQLICDAFEDNDNSAQAKYPSSKATYIDLECLYGDEDWYKVQMRRDETFAITINFENNSGNLDLAVYNHTADGSFGDLLHVSQSESDQESISFAGGIDHYYPYPWYSSQYYYWIKVNNTTPGTKNDYSMTVQGWDGDEYENNDIFNDSVRMEEGTFEDLTCVLGDDDWFKVKDLVKGRKFFSSVSASGNLDLYLYDENSTLLTYSAGSGNDDEVSYIIDDEDYVYLNIKTTSATKISYSLTLDRSYHEHEEAWWWDLITDPADFIDDAFSDIKDVEAMKMIIGEVHEEKKHKPVGDDYIDDYYSSVKGKEVDITFFTTEDATDINKWEEDKDFDELLIVDPDEDDYYLFPVINRFLVVAANVDWDDIADDIEESFEEEYDDYEDALDAHDVDEIELEAKYNEDGLHLTFKIDNENEVEVTLRYQTKGVLDYAIIEFDGIPIIIIDLQFNALNFLADNWILLSVIGVAGVGGTVAIIRLIKKKRSLAGLAGIPEVTE